MSSQNLIPIPLEVSHHWREIETLSCTRSAARTRQDLAAVGRRDGSPKKPQLQDLNLKPYPRLKFPQDNGEHPCPYHQPSQHPTTSNSSPPGRQEHREMTSVLQAHGNHRKSKRPKYGPDAGSSR